MNSVTGSAILQIMDLAGQKAVQLVKNRIQSSGKNATDNRFSPYLTEYKTARKRESLQVEYKDFTRTGKMFDDFKVQKTGQNGSVFYVEVGISDARSEKIAKAHSAKEGVLIIAMNENEKNEIEKYIQSEFLKAWQQLNP